MQGMLRRFVPKLAGVWRMDFGASSLSLSATPKLSAPKSKEQDFQQFLQAFNACEMESQCSSFVDVSQRLSHLGPQSPVLLYEA